MSFLANDVGELGKSPDLTSWEKSGMSRSAYVKKLLSETPDEEWTTERLMAEYDARPMGTAANQDWKNYLKSLTINCRGLKKTN